MSSTQILLRMSFDISSYSIFISFISGLSNCVGREHLSASRYLNLQGLKVPGGTQQNCRTQVPAQPYTPKSTLHIKCSILRPPKYWPTHIWEATQSMLVDPLRSPWPMSNCLIINLHPSSLQKSCSQRPRLSLSSSRITKDSNNMQVCSTSPPQPTWLISLLRYGTDSP